MTQAPTVLRKFTGFVPPEKNYFHMPNEWIDICAEIDNLAEIKVIQYVLRHTWGYQEYGIAKAITVDEFMHGRKRTDGTRMDKGTGLKSDRSVKDGLKAAIQHGYLVYDVDATDLARIKKSYALKMVSTEGYNLPLDVRQVDITPLQNENRQVVSTPLTGSIYPSEVQNLPLGGTKSTPRTEKDTIERHYKKDTKETQEREVAIATARSQSSSSQEISQDETVKREAVKSSQKDTAHETSAHPAPGSTVVGNAGTPGSNRPERQDTNKVTQPPAPKKPPTNTIPKRPRQQPIAMPEPIPEKALHIMDRWDAVHKKPAPRTPKTVQAAQLLMVYDPSEDELRDCEKWLYTTDRPGKPWYRSHGVHLPDIAEKIGSWQSLQDAPKPTDKDASNEHNAVQHANAFIARGYDKEYNKRKLEEMREKNALKRQAQAAKGVQL